MSRDSQIQASSISSRPRSNPESPDGLYLVVLRISESITVEVGALGPINFEPGHYVYVGSARKNRDSRLERHRRIDKPLHWHLDYLRPHTEWIEARLFDAEDECSIASELAAAANERIDRFGSSDCRCPGHLLWFRREPADLPGEPWTVL